MATRSRRDDAERGVPVARSKPFANPASPPPRRCVHARNTRTTKAAARAIGLFMFAASWVGCSQPTTEKYHVADETEIACVNATDMGIPKEAFEEAGTRLIDHTPSIGRFPVGLCVVRVAARIPTDEGGPHVLRVSELSPHHAVYWNHLFDALPEIREVAFLNRCGLDPRGAATPAILRLASKIECGLCMIYARLEETDADAEYVGVLWDTERLTALAVVRTPVVLPEDVRERIEEEEGETAEVDRSIWEADFRAEQDFRSEVRDVVWNLVDHDGRAPTTQPNPWRQDDVPLFPRDYRRYRDSRLERLFRKLDG